MARFAAVVWLAFGAPLLFASSLPEGYQEALEEIAAAQSRKYNCSISIAVRTAGGSAAAARGVVDFSTGLSARPEDRFAFGSATKMLTAASVLHLVSEGKISLEDLVAPLVDPVLAGMADQDPTQDFASMADLFGAANITNVTVRHLLGMEAGLPDFDTAMPCWPTNGSCVPTDPLRNLLYDSPDQGLSPGQLLGLPWVSNTTEPRRCLGQGQGGQTPGDKAFCYSSTNYVLLGLLLVSQQNNATWDTFDQGGILPADLRERLRFARHGAPQDYTAVHGYDRTSYNMPSGVKADHDNWQVSGVYSGWTASDLTAPAAAVADLVWEIYGPESATLPKNVSNLMVPAANERYGLGTFNLRMITGHDEGDLAAAHGHPGATYGYQSVSAYFPHLQAAISVASNVETDYMEPPADAICFAYNRLASMLLNRTITCTFREGGYWGGGCFCDVEAEEVTLVV